MMPDTPALSRIAAIKLIVDAVRLEDAAITLILVIVIIVMAHILLLKYYIQIV